MGLNLNTPQVKNYTGLNPVRSGATTDTDNNVKYVPQTLTEAQQAQARQNIGAGEPQVQADWNQTDTTAPDYIKNKPEITPSGATINEFVYTRTGEPGEYTGVISCEGYEPKEGDLMTISFAGPFYTEYNPVTLNNGTTNPTVTLLNAEVNATDYDEINPEVNTKWTVRLTKVNDAWVAVNISTQVQPDWNTSDSTMPSYIKNKPEISDGPVDDRMLPFYAENTSSSDVTCIITGTYGPIQGSTDNKTWTDLMDSTQTDVEFVVPANGRYYLKAKISHGTPGGGGIELGYQITNLPDTIGGNLLSLTYTNFSEIDNIEVEGARFQSCFAGNTNLKSASKLKFPRGVIESPGFAMQMFNGCTSLTEAPELPAYSAGQQCYEEMFQNCTSLVKAPELPATTVGDSCYRNMFNGCTSLITAPELPATTLAWGCYQSMFNACTSLVKAPALPATTLATQCYHTMFGECSSLTIAPALPATTLANYCYSAMFYNCTSLVVGPAIAQGQTISYGNSFEQFFDGCRSLRSVSDLKITDLTGTEMYYFFHYCSSLHEIYCYATNIDNPNFGDCFDGISPVGTFYCASGMKSTWESLNVIPSGWTIVEM